MKRLVFALFALFALGTVALASSLPQNGTVVVTNDSGVQVGTGTIADGKLSLTLDAGTSGLVTISVTGSGGETETYQAMIDSSGQVTVVHDSSFEDLTSFAKGSGIGSVEVSESTESPSSDGNASAEQSPDGSSSAEDGSSSGSEASSSHDSTDSHQSEGSQDASGNDDSVDVGTSLDGTVNGGEGSASVDGSVEGSASADD